MPPGIVVTRTDPNRIRSSKARTGRLRTFPSEQIVTVERVEREAFGPFCGFLPPQTPNRRSFSDVTDANAGPSQLEADYKSARSIVQEIFPTSGDQRRVFSRSGPRHDRRVASGDGLMLDARMTMTLAPDDAALKEI